MRVVLDLDGDQHAIVRLLRALLKRAAISRSTPSNACAMCSGSLPSRGRSRSRLGGTAADLDGARIRRNPFPKNEPEVQDGPCTAKGATDGKYDCA